MTNHSLRSLVMFALAVASSTLSCGGSSGGGSTTAVKGQFCDKVVAGLAKCPDNAISKSACLGKLAAYSDDQVREGTDCLRETSCDGMVQCLEEAFPDTGPPGTGGTGGKPGTGGSTGQTSCAGQAASDTCEQCLFGSCCNQVVACASDKACAAFIDCIGKCNVNMVCQMNCIAQTADASLALFQSFAQCSNSKCATPCQ
jgi:hypothetical protein